jgi:hypothetical protein
MTTTALYDPHILINDEQIVFKPNSVTVVSGLGEVKVEALSSGGGFVETVHTEDVSTKISKLKAMLSNTDENQEKIRTWKTLVGQNKITISEGEFHSSLRQVSMINDPESQFKSESEIEIEFNGSPAV